MPTVRVRVPATSANLGPGFDTLGLALNIYNYVTINEAQDGVGRIILAGEGSDNEAALTDRNHNIAVLAVRHLFQFLNEPLTPFDLTLENGIPPARGLGSSAAARVGALVAANEWAKQSGHRSASTAELITLATQLEGHPDNVAPALLGGLVVSTIAESQHPPRTAGQSLSDETKPKDDLPNFAQNPITRAETTGTAAATSSLGATQRDAPAHHDPTPQPPIEQALAVQMPVAEFPGLVVFIPDSELATSAARAVLPDAVFRADTTFNMAHTALLLAALATRQWDLLPEALRDRLHQDHRARLMPGFHAILRAAAEAGAYGATLSGAGPTILAWLPTNNENLTQEVCRALQDAAAEHEVFGKALLVTVDLEGCVVTD
ncbi:MAG: homoserine kinase [Abitibacteriaceae bacterium]|nr:homoserine kinase [Abditibacteriaceae bacterium]